MQNGSGQVELKLMNKFSGLVEECFANPAIQVNDIADKLYLTEGQLRRKSKALLNIYPTDSLRNYRLQKVASVLKEGMTVSEVYLSAAPFLHSYFSKCFKVKYGISSTDYGESN